MKKMKVLIPLDGTERSMHSLDWLKKMFNKDTIEITLMNVIEIVMTNDIIITEQIKSVQEESELALDKAMREVENYKVEKCVTFGHAADEILKKAREDKFDIIIMTKSNKKGLVRMVGSVTSKVVKGSQTLVLVVPQ